MPLITRPQVYRVVRELLPRERFGPEGCYGWRVFSGATSGPGGERRAAGRAATSIPP